MRWPFKPPHMTLKPSKRNTKKQQNKKKKTKKREKKQEETKNTQKWAFQLSVKIFLFLGGCPKFPKSAHPKNTIKVWVSANFFWKTHMRHETAIFGPKSLNSQIPVIIFLACFLLSQQQKTQKCWNPYFYSVLANQKKENFQILYLKHWNWKTQFLHPFFEKRLFLENCQIIGHKKKHTKW